jgi:hypothetical protein
MENDEQYARLLSAIAVLQVAIVEIGKTLAPEHRDRLLSTLERLEEDADETPGGLSSAEAANNIRRWIQMP